MLILNFYQVVQWTERIQRCTVRGARIPNPEIAISLRRHWKLHLVVLEIELFRIAARFAQPIKSRR